jgi:hypothetical protein
MMVCSFAPGALPHRILLEFTLFFTVSNVPAEKQGEFNRSYTTIAKSYSVICPSFLSGQGSGKGENET